MLSGGSIEEASRRTASSMEPHPMLAGGSIEEAVRREVALLAPLRERADYIINTTGLTTAMLQARIADILPDGRAGRRLTVTVTAFGYKYGLPMDADLVFDVRFLPNPFYVEELRSMSGLDKPVSDFVFSCGDARRFLEMLVSMLKFLMPLYLEEGKYNLNIAIGCTGGRHRSVAVTNALADRLSELGFQTARSFRDLEKG